MCAIRLHLSGGNSLVQSLRIATFILISPLLLRLILELLLAMTWLSRHSVRRKWPRANAQRKACRKSAGTRAGRHLAVPVYVEHTEAEAATAADSSASLAAPVALWIFFGATSSLQVRAAFGGSCRLPVCIHSALASTPPPLLLRLPVKTLTSESNCFKFHLACQTQ